MEQPVFVDERQDIQKKTFTKWINAYLSKRLIEEFESNAKSIEEMKQQVANYQEIGKLTLSQRLQEQVDLLETRFVACQKKLNRFTSPQSGFESRLNRAMGELRNIERSSVVLDVSSANPSCADDQMQHCLKMYRILSEIKSEIESVIKTGRKICEDTATKNPKRLGQKIDTLKHLYNNLGETVTESKKHLEVLLKLVNELNENFEVIEKFLKTQSVIQNSDDMKFLDTDEAEAKATELALGRCYEIYEEYKTICDATYLGDLKDRIDILNSRFAKIMKRNDDCDEIKMLNEMKSTLQNMDNISIETLRTMESDLEKISKSNPEIEKLHGSVVSIIKSRIENPVKPVTTNKLNEHQLLPLEDRVSEFEENAQIMINRLEETSSKIFECSEMDSIEDLKMESAPDAAALISQGDSLVLETHGKSPSLSQRVMRIQHKLREKFMAMKLIRNSMSKKYDKDVQKASTENSKRQIDTITKIQNEGYNKPNEYDIAIEKATKENALRQAETIKEISEKEPRLNKDLDEIEELVSKVLKQTKDLIEKPLNDSSIDELSNRIGDIKERQDDLKSAIKIASQVTPSHKAKVTMENLQRAKTDLSTHCDVVSDTLATLNSGRLSQEITGNEAKPPTSPTSDNKKDEPYVPGSFTKKQIAKVLPPTFSLAGNFDKSIQQISDWLLLEQEMLKTHSIFVGDIDGITTAIKKQESMLRELKLKKPQLDELVHTAETLKTDANRQQLQSKVSRLREHWDETSQCVLQRKTQLAAMLDDSRRYEAKRIEIETWMQRMENRADRMDSVATTADVLDAQQKEQKSFHAELHQFKHQIEYFNTLTQKLIAVYPSDDTSRIKRMTEAVNIRYNNLTSAVINRGKMLHAAVHNLQSFDKTMDKFLAWLSEAESLTENFEDMDRNPHLVKVSFLGKVLKAPPLKENLHFWRERDGYIV